jgi:superfamily II DNA helicase RecQ
VGADKRNVRAGIHFSKSSSVEAYIQEAGRGGRDEQRICQAVGSNKISRLKSGLPSLDYRGDGVDNPTLKNALAKILKQHWGYDSFRPLQREAMETNNKSESCSRRKTETRRDDP